MTEVGEPSTSPASPDKCPPHSWKEVDSKTPDEGKQENENKANAAVTSGNTHSANSTMFENHAIDDNMDKLKIEKVSVKYECNACSAKTEVDILGEDGQVAECKSKKKADLVQGALHKDIQKQLNPNKTALAKIDATHPKSNRCKKGYLNGGHTIEMVQGFSRPF